MPRGGGRGGGRGGHGGGSHHRGGGFTRFVGGGYSVFAPYPYFEDPPEDDGVVLIPVRIHGEEEDEDEDINTRLRRGLVIG